MLEKLFENKKIWIPSIIAVIVVIAILIGLFFGKDSDDMNGREQSKTGNETEESQEDGLNEVQDGNATSEDTITPPDSWDGSENSSNNGGNNSSNTTKDNSNKEKDTSSGMSSGEVLEDKDNKQFGTIF